MYYQESPPSARFAHLIECFWSLEQSAAQALDSREPIVPDGKVEIVFNLADRFRRFSTDTEFQLQPQTLVAGQMTRSIVIGPTGEVSLFGVRFRHSGAYGLFGFPMSELSNRIEDANLLGLGAGIGGRLKTASCLGERISIFEALFDGRLVRIETPDSKFNAAVRIVASMPENFSVSKTAAMLGWSERKLERDFQKFVGVSPKVLSRISRFAAIVRLLETNGPARLLDHAHDYGYYDQSHMINEFRSFSGESPTAFYRRSHRLSELFTVGG